jgi:hypothetical protein
MKYSQQQYLFGLMNGPQQPKAKAPKRAKAKPSATTGLNLIFPLSYGN